MAPYQMKANSKPKFKPLARRRTIAGRIEKQEKNGIQNSKNKTLEFLRTLSVRTKKDCPNAPASQVKQEPLKPALSDRVNEESLVTNPPTPTVNAACPPQNNKRLFKLRKAIPKAGLRFPGEWEGKRSILGN